MSNQSSAEKQASGGGPPLQFHFEDKASMFNSSEAIDKALAQYVISAVEAIGDPRDVFLATDKGSVGNLSLQITFIGTNDNWCVVACPQAVMIH